MKSIVLSHSETGRLVTREVSLGVTTSELKNVVKEAFPALSWADLSDIRLSVDDVEGGGAGGGEGCGSNRERVLSDEERLCDVVEEMEETRVKVKVHRMLPLCCVGCERPYDVCDRAGRSGESAKARVALNPCLLQCGHSMCVECAGGMMKKHEEEAEEVVSRHEVKRVKMVCPIAGCGRESCWLNTEEEKKVEVDEKEAEEEVDGPDSTAFFPLPPHAAMEEYIKWQRSHVDEESMRRCQDEAAMECSECGSRGNVVCENCNHRVYCDKCHPVMWQHHRFISLSLANHHSEVIREKVEEQDVKCRRCESHPEEECTLYCRSEGCECLVCSRCVFIAQQHFQHDVIPLAEAVASVSKRLEVAQESWLKLIDIKMGNVSRSQLSWEEMSADLEKLFDALERRLRELRQTTMEDMRRRYVNAEKSLVEESVKVGEQLGRLHVCVDQCQQVMKSDSVVHSNLDLKYSPSALVKMITRCDAVLRMLPDEDEHPIDTLPSVTKSVLNGLLTVCRPYRLEASRVCGESITVRFHTAFASVGPMNENVVELGYREITDDDQESDGSRTDVNTQRVSGVVHDHQFTIQGLTPNKKYRIRIVGNPGVELICRTSHLTGGEIWVRFCAFFNSVEADKEVIEAINCYEELVKEGSDGAALAFLGVCYHHGIRMTKDVTKAIEFYRAAAELNNDDGQFLLADCYDDGDGVEKSVSEAVRLYRLAAEQGHPIAQNNLGYCYETGEGVEENYSEAVKWFRRSAHQGDPNGQYNLGYCYFEGHGVEKDLIEAFKLLQLSADQGHETALYKLGECYENGYGVFKNLNKAELCYKDGARKGFTEAEDALERLNVPLD